MACVDGHATKKTEIVMHHAVSDLMLNWSDAKVAKWFSDVGRNRGYAGVAHSYHCNPYDGTESFSQAHYCLHPYTADKNKYGWRLTLLIKEPYSNACWHASNWTVNQRSLGIETAGNYVAQYLDEKALMLVADTFRAYDKSIGGGLNITGHKKYAATACPGKIYEQLGTLIDMFNNPAKWNEKLWPSTDEYYRVFEAGKQVGAYKIKDNAFNTWYEKKAIRTVTYNGKDITSEFKAMANVLEKKITDLEKQIAILKTTVSNQESEIAKLTAMVESGADDLLALKAENADLKRQITDLGQANAKLKEDLAKCRDLSKNFIDSIWGKLYLIFNKP